MLVGWLRLEGLRERLNVLWKVWVENKKLKMQNRGRNHSNVLRWKANMGG